MRKAGRDGTDGAERNSHLSTRENIRLLSKRRGRGIGRELGRGRRCRRAGEGQSRRFERLLRVLSSSIRRNVQVRVRWRRIKVRERIWVIDLDGDIQTYVFTAPEEFGMSKTRVYLPGKTLTLQRSCQS